MKNFDKPLFSEPLLSFSLGFYDKPDVPEVCLYLQDECGCDVLVVLWCLWLEAQNKDISEEYLAEVISIVDKFSGPSVQSLRALRRQLPSLNFLSGDRQKAVKRSILEAEIECEKAILDALFAWTLNQYSKHMIDGLVESPVEKHISSASPSHSTKDTVLHRYICSLGKNTMSSYDDRKVLDLLDKLRAALYA